MTFINVNPMSNLMVYLQYYSTYTLTDNDLMFLMIKLGKL